MRTTVAVDLAERFWFDAEAAREVMTQHGPAILGEDKTLCLYAPEGKAINLIKCRHLPEGDWIKELDKHNPVVAGVYFRRLPDHVFAFAGT